MTLMDPVMLMDRIRAGDTDAAAELYRVFQTRIRYALLAQLRGDSPEDVGDRLHDCFLIVLAAIRRGAIHDPACLMAYCSTVAVRASARGIRQRIQTRLFRTPFEDDFTVYGPDNPEQAALKREREAIASRAINAGSRRDREILHRFYVLEQPHAYIKTVMGLTSTQFRLLKSRAIGRCRVRIAGMTG